VRGSGCGKVCAACVKAKQRCGGFLGEEKQPVAESMGLGEVTVIWRLKHGREYQAMVLGKDGKNVEEEMEVEKEKEKEGDEGDEMEVDGMVAGPSGSAD
jgi:hypothetical protein